MTLIRTHYPSISDLIDGLIHTATNERREGNRTSTGLTLPNVNIWEDDQGYGIELAAPGLKKEDFTLHLDQNLLSISYEKDEADTHDKTGYVRREFVISPFKRVFTLPESSDIENISASYRDGILSVSIPKKEEAIPRPPRTISIS